MRSIEETSGRPPSAHLRQNSTVEWTARAPGHHPRRLMPPQPTSDPEVITLGETLVDLFLVGLNEHWGVEPRTGGAPGNVASGLAELGHDVASVSRIGADPMGALAVASLRLAGVNTRWIQYDNVRPTTLAVVSPPDSHGGFTIYLQGSASAHISETDLPFPQIAAARVLHVGSLSMASPISRSATRTAIAYARASGALISLDVNLRPSCWPSAIPMVRAAVELIEFADVVKLTADEASILGHRGGSALHSGTRVVLTTDGGREAHLTVAGHTVTRTPPHVDVVDPTGAGDAFLAMFLHRLLTDVPRGTALQDVPNDFWADALATSVGAGSAAVQRTGASRLLPSLASVLAVLDELGDPKKGVPAATTR